MPIASTREILDRAYAAYGAGDLDAFLATLHDDIDWILFIPVQVFPFGGPRKGVPAVAEVIKDLGARYELERFEPEPLIVEGDRAARIIHSAFRQRTTGRTLSLRIADFLRVEDGLIREFREFMDTFDVVEQALGRWLPVNDGAA